VTRNRDRWNPYRAVEPSGFIKEFKEMVVDSIKTSPEWIESIGIGILSSVCGNFVFPNTSGPVKLNVWTLAVGPSGTAKKTMPLNYYAIPLVRRISNMTERGYLFPKGFSTEGMVERLSIRSETGQYINNQGILIRDEFSQVFKDMKKDYLADTLEFMSELFDGTTQSRYTKSSKLEEVHSVYMCLLGATTETLYGCMEKNFFVQGTGNRFLYLIIDPPKHRVQMNPNYFFRQESRQRREDAIDTFASKLASIPDSSFNDLQPDVESGELWSEYEYEIMSECDRLQENDRRNLESAYLNRMPMAILKLSGLAAVSRHYDTIFRTRDTSRLETLMIIGDDMKWAIGKVERHVDHFYRMLREWRTEPVPRRVETHEAQLDFVLQCFRDSPDRLRTAKEIIKITRLARNQSFYELMGTLVTIGDIIELKPEEIRTLTEKTRKTHDISLVGKLPIVYKLNV
jgi:hypothetical protein